MLKRKLGILIDLFSGAGGLSHGFELTGFKIDLAIELEKNYFKSYKCNHSKTLSLNEDITKLVILSNNSPNTGSLPHITVIKSSFPSRQIAQYHTNNENAYTNY